MLEKCIVEIRFMKAMPFCRIKNRRPSCDGHRGAAAFHCEHLLLHAPQPARTGLSPASKPSKRALSDFRIFSRLPNKLA